MTEKIHDALRLLGLGVDASEKDIKQAYRKLARSLHPDKNPSAEAATLFVKVKKAHEHLIEHHKRVELKVDASQAAKAKEAYKTRKKGANRWGAKAEPTAATSQSSSSSAPRKRPPSPPKRDTSHCAKPHKIRFKWDREKFKYKREFFETLFPDYYDIVEEELYEFRDGYCFVLFRDDLAALDAHQKALELRPKPLKVKWITKMPDLAQAAIDSGEECFVVEKKSKKKVKKAKYERGYYKDMYDREQAEKRVDDQWSSRAKKKVEHHQDLL